jgi:1-aminocyclopropane-1-carboxylate deaminase
MEEAFPDYSRIIIQPVRSPRLPLGLQLEVLRLDLLHPQISGNKWFKLKYNLEVAAAAGKNTILTFGGAWSNHIAATAAACRLLGFGSVGIIRGEEPGVWSETLLKARENGMRLQFISREQYRRKQEEGFLEELSLRHPEAWIIPEGGNNAAGLRGCLDIASFYEGRGYTDICCAVGTGTTLCGLISATGTARVTGFAVLKNAGRLGAGIQGRLPPKHASWELVTGYHFGGFAKKTEELLSFMRSFHQQQGIPLDFVYTAKMMWGVMDLAQKGYFPEGGRILAVHTGGLQGNQSLATFTA